MGKLHFGRKVTILVIAAVLLLGSFTVMASQILSEIVGNKDTIMQLTDSSAWEGSADRIETIGDVTTINGETYAAYTGYNIGNELVEFKAEIAPSPDGWFGLRLRSNNPLGAPWDNAAGYMFIIRRTGAVELLRQDGLVALSDATISDIDLSGNTQYKITVGAVTAKDESSVRLVLKVDDTVVMEYTDTNTKNMTLIPGVFSLYQYGESSLTKVTVFPGEGDALGGLVDRKAPATTKVLPLDDQWFINNVPGMAENGGLRADMSISSNKLTVSGNGGVTNNNMITADTYSFDFSMSKVVEPVSSGKYGSSIVLFCKQVRDDLNGRNSTGIRFTEDGKISLVTYSGGNQKIWPAYETGLNFNEEHHITVEVISNLDAEEWYADVYIYIDSDTQAYKYCNKRYNPNLEPPGFFGVLNTDNNVISVISNIKHNGEMEAGAEESESISVYMADVMKVGEEEFLHWEWRADSVNAKYVLITTPNGKNIGTTPYPEKTFTIKDLEGQYDSLYLYTVNIEGTYSEPVKVDLTKKASELQVDSIERIVIAENSDGSAGFKLKDSGTTFIPNGVNYIGLRYGDHSTFEPAYGLVPADYDPYTAETLMRTLKENGYNFIRVFIIPGGRVDGNAGLGGNYEETKGIYISYMECFTDFLTRANKYGIYVMPVMGENEMVNNQYFANLSGGASGQAILFSEAGISAKAKFLQYFLEYLKEKNPKLLDGLLGISMQNEFCYNANQAPFTQTSGEYTFLDGTEYDMTNDDERRALANAALQNYYAKMKAAISEIDEQMLICEGTFAMVAVDKDMDSCHGMRMTEGVKDARIPMSAEEYLATDIDFLDLHIYRYGLSGTAEDIWEIYKENMLLETEQTMEYRKSKPIIMGEYAGMSTEATEQTLEAGMLFAQTLRNAVMDGGFAGAAYWTIDSFEQEGIWNLMWENGKYLPYISLLNVDGTPRDNWDSENYLK